MYVYVERLCAETLLWVKCGPAGILRNYERTPGTVTQLMDQLLLESLADRRSSYDLLYYLKLSTTWSTSPHDHLLTIAVIAQHGQRGSHSLKFMTISTRTDVLKYSFFPRTVIDVDV